MTVSRIVPNLQSPDPAGTRELYVDILGLEPVMDMEWIVTYAVPGRREAQLAVIAEDATAPVHPDVSIEVDDADAVHAAVVARGYEVVHPLTDEPWGVRRFFLREPGGRVINVLSHR